MPPRVLIAANDYSDNLERPGIIIAEFGGRTIPQT